MKVLTLINSLNMGGAEQLVSQLVTAFRPTDITMDLLVLGSSDTPLAKTMEEEGMAVKYLNVKSFYDPRISIKLKPYFSDYDLVHVHLFPALYWAGLCTKLAALKTPLVFTEHSTFNKRRSSFMGKWLDRYFYSRYKHVVCITKEVEQNLKAHLGSGRPPTSIIPNGIDFQRFNNARPHDRAAIKLNATDKIILQVSSFREAKDHPTLIRALGHLPAEFKLVLIGIGPLEQSMKDLVKELNLSERVRFLGIRSDVPELLKMADYTVLSTNYEGMSMACMEGMASGRPFIASDVPGVRELVGGHGLLFRHQDPEHLASSILKLEEEGATKQNLVYKCMDRAREFSIQTTAKQHINLYQTLCESRR